MAQHKPRGATEAESTLRKYLSLDFPLGTEFITIRETRGQRRLIVWLFRWPGDVPLPRHPLPFCELCLAGNGGPVLKKLSRSDFGLQEEELRRVGGLVTTVPVYYGPDEWVGLPRDPQWIELALSLLHGPVARPGGPGPGKTATDARHYRAWVNEYPSAVRAQIEAVRRLFEVGLEELPLAESGYFPGAAEAKLAKDRYRALVGWVPASEPPAIVRPEVCVVIARDPRGLADVLARPDGELVALVSQDCWLWRAIYRAGAVYVPAGEVSGDASAWVANSDAVLKAAGIRSAWRGDVSAPVAARSAANFIARVTHRLPISCLVDALHEVGDQNYVTFRLLPAYVPWIEAAAVARFGGDGGHRGALPPVVAVHAGWSGMADWATEFLDRRAGPDRREMVDRLLRDGI